MNIKTLTIGIPAYNEEANIGYLIQNIFNQKYSHVALKKVIVSSDGSTDRTVSILRRIHNPHIRIFVNKDRQGVARGLNQIISHTRTDILVILDADVLLLDKLFIEKLVRPVVNSQADLTSSSIAELPSSQFIPRVLFVSMRIKDAIFKKINHGNNLYTCHGPARSFSRDLYKNMVFPSRVGDDMFSYLYAAYNNYTYKYVKNAAALYKQPETFMDHQKQSIRFFKTKSEQVGIFGYEFVKRQAGIPSSVFLIAAPEIFALIIRNPIHSLAYVVIVVSSKIRSLFIKNLNDAWDTSVSSKVLVSHI
jgi:glycosyltransferase involved in cell wall biosynthesis